MNSRQLRLYQVRDKVQWPLSLSPLLVPSLVCRSHSCSCRFLLSKMQSNTPEEHSGYTVLLCATVQLKTRLPLSSVACCGVSETKASQMKAAMHNSLWPSGPVQKIHTVQIEPGTAKTLVHCFDNFDENNRHIVS